MSVAAAARHLPSVHKDDLDRQQQRPSNHRRSDDVIAELQEQMWLPVDTLEAIRDEFIAQLEANLAGQDSSILMLPSMVDFLPTGYEVGQFLAIDIGGSNFRVLYSRLSSEQGAVEETRMEEWSIPDEMRHCSVTELFDFMAATAVDFVNKFNIVFGAGLPSVGFCFSFPVQQHSVDSGKIVQWTKGFEVSESEDVDLVQLLEMSFQKQGLPVCVRVMINDTVATLCAARYEEQDANIGLILGTGINIAYVEGLDRISSLPSDYIPHAGATSMIINTECGNFVSPVLPRLPEDEALAEETTNPNVAHFEKMMSGLYMGEIARRLILRLAEEYALFGGLVPEKLLHGYYTFTTPQMAAIDSDDSPQLTATAEIMNKVFHVNPQTLTLQARQQIQRVCGLVAIRSARLLATAIASILRHTGRDDVINTPRTVVAVDGGVYGKYKQYRDAVDIALKDLLGDEVFQRVAIRLTPDGSCMGAAHLAAAAEGREGRT